MEENPEVELGKWKKRCLVLAIIITVLTAMSFLLGRTPKIGTSNATAILLPILIVWGPVTIYLGLRATSSIIAGVISMAYVVTGCLGAVTPGVDKLVALILLLLGIFYFYFCIKTWHLHEKYWFKKVAK